MVRLRTKPVAPALNGRMTLNTRDRSSKPLVVPERHADSFEAIREMGEDEFPRLLSIFESAGPTDDREAICRLIREATSLGASDAIELLDAVTGLAAHAHLSQSSVSEIASRVASSPQFVRMDDPDEDLAIRIERLLRCDSIRVYSKALALGSRHERIFVDAQVLTDMRPLFGDDLDDETRPEGMLISHTLSLHFVDSDGAHDNFFVVLDDQDVLRVQQLLARATTKSAAVRSLLQESGVTYLRLEE